MRKCLCDACGKEVGLPAVIALNGTRFDLCVECETRLASLLTSGRIRGILTQRG